MQSFLKKKKKICLFFVHIYICALTILYFRDPDLVKRIGAATALEVRATGIPYVFAPCIAVRNDLKENFESDHISEIIIIKY